MQRRMALDVDETLFNSVSKHVRILTEIGKRFGWKNLPTYEEVLSAGGTHKAYGHYPHYMEVNEMMRNAEWFNRDLEVIDEALNAMFYADAMVSFYLTTRPDSLTAVTYEELIKHGFPDREVICRPGSVPLEKTTEWKLSVLEDRAKNEQARMVMVDDSVSLHEAIKKRKTQRVGTLLYAGPMTPRGNGEVAWPEVLKKVHVA